MQDVYYPSSDGKTNIHACIWQAEGETKAVLQIMHGMAEYAQRYSPIAEHLNKYGITVCAEDHLGHGKSQATADDAGYFADERGYAPVLKDIRTLGGIVKEKYAGVPYFIMGHSMGSFFCRKYMALYGEELAGAIIMGTGFQSAAKISLAKSLTNTIATVKGWRYRSNFLVKSAFGSYNKNFENRTPFDWLSADSGNVDRYIADGMCGVQFTCNAFYGLFEIIGEACKNKTISAVPDNLPVLVISGGDDPVGGFGKGVEKFVNKMLARGKSVQMILYRGCRHEIINDVCAPQVEEDIRAFLAENIK